MKDFVKKVKKLVEESGLSIEEATNILCVEIADNTEDPYIIVDGKKEMKDGSGMIKESGEANV